jgi:hypothetical protein
MKVEASNAASVDQLSKATSNSLLVELHPVPKTPS